MAEEMAQKEMEGKGIRREKGLPKNGQTAIKSAPSKSPLPPREPADPDRRKGKAAKANQPEPRGSNRPIKKPSELDYGFSVAFGTAALQS